MKKLILTGLLLATATTQVFAQDQNHGDWQHNGNQNGSYQNGQQGNGDHRDGDHRDGDHRNGDNRGGDQRDGGYRGGGDQRGGGWHGNNDHRDGGWHGDWRNDNRYRWEDYRRDNRQVFSLDRFYAPRGWSYRRFSVGVIVPGIVFGPRYWIRDPYAFRLPPAPYGAHWVRYYGDALLVQNRSGRVLDVVYGIFN